jgi:D-inositol-3-phosphate glycosyltransferase
MAQAAVCAFPSRWESFGLVVAEAASIGRPVVVSDIPEFRDYVEDGVSARVVAVDDAEGWAQALLATLSHPSQAREMAIRLREEIATRADPRRVTELAIESYEAAIARRSSR